MTVYDNELREIDIYKIHPSLLPFVGKEYAQYRLLQIGESHYINQSYENEKFGIEYFQRWWTESCEEALMNSQGWVDTRGVMHNYIYKERNGSSYTIFTNFLKSFSKIVLGKEISSITMEDKELYQYVAFMNFFQIPSLYEGEEYWDSIHASAKKCGNASLASEMWKMAVEISTETLDRTIEILDPKAIVFTSISAGKAYKEYGGRYSNDSRVIYTSHPGYPYTWWKELKSLGYKRGIDVCEEGLRRMYGE